MFPLFLIAFLIRLIGINQSLWLDEATTARVVQQFSFSEILTKFSPFDFHPPLYYFFIKVWTNIFGYSEIALRMPSVFFSLITGFIIYRLVHSIRPTPTESVIAAAFFLFNPLIIYYSQEARPYMMIVLLTTLVAYFVINLIGSPAGKESRDRIYQILFSNVFIFLSLLTFYGSVFFITAVYLYLLFKKLFEQLVYLLPGSIIAGALLYPLFAQQLKHSGEILQLVPNWSATLGTANLKNLLLIPLKFSVGRISWEPKAIYYLISGTWTIFVFYFIFYNLKLKTFYFFAAPILIGFLASFYKPLLQYFRFLYVIPFMAMLLALHASKNWQRCVLFSGFLLFSLCYLLLPMFHREDWRSLAKSLPKSATVFMVPSSSDPIAYYRSDVHIADIQKAQNAGSKIILIPYTADIHEVDYKNTLKKKGKQQVQVSSFRGLAYEVWQ